MLRKNNKKGSFELFLLQKYFSNQQICAIIIFRLLIPRSKNGKYRS